MTTKADKPDKEKIVAEFETMKSFELSAEAMYSQIAADECVAEQKVKDAFARLAADERRHAVLVQEILDLVHRAM